MPGGRPIQADTVLEARRRMDAAGARNVTIVVSGRLSPERIRTLLDNDAPVDVFHDTGYIAAAKPLPYLPNIRTIADRTVPQENRAASAEPAPAPAPVRRG